MQPAFPITLAQVGPDWSCRFEGLPLAWGLLLLLALAGATLWAYFSCAPGLPAGRRYALAALRIGIALILVFLLVKPVVSLNFQEPVPRRLAVLLDASQSMAVADRRDRPEDQLRAGIAAGLADPAKGLGQSVPTGAAELRNISRWDLLAKLAANPKFDFWPRLRRQVELEFYRVGRDAVPLGPLDGKDQTPLTAARAGEFFALQKAAEPATALGDTVRQVLQNAGEQASAGIFLITDGQSNTGAPALEAAQLAKERGVPLYIYGLGVTSPPDVILQEVSSQKLAFVKERVEVKARVRVQDLKGKLITGVLSADGVAVDEKSFTVAEDGEYTLDFSFIPEEEGELSLEVNLPLLPEETGKENNRAQRRLRVTDTRFKVLLVEQKPRWDFRYLLDYLVRDRRLEVHCVVIDGEPSLGTAENSPFLPKLPEDRETLFNSQVLILGDVNPEDLGDDRMRMIKEWVETGGGIIFLSGSHWNPRSYAGTPLEALLPVVPDTISAPEEMAQRSPEPFKLQLTALGESSPYLRMAQDPEENRALWDAFPGVRWTAPLARLKPGAESLLVDPRPERSGRSGLLPVFAVQGYGAGRCVYLGTDETYQWRSHTGERFYSILWGQIMQSLALQLLEAGSPRTQLKTDRSEYGTGDTVTISGRAYSEGFEPLIAPNLEGTVRLENSAEAPQTINLSALPDQGGFRGQFVPPAPGDYVFSSAHDPDSLIRFTVADPRLEQAQTALNERLLTAMAQTSGGRYFREETLHELPALLERNPVTVARLKRLELYHSPWWLAPLFLFAFSEWLLRKLSRLK